MTKQTQPEKVYELFRQTTEMLGRRRLHRVAAVVTKVVTGDRTGTIVFLLALVFFGLTWRVGPFINDNYTIANTLVAVSEGHLNIDRAVYQPTAWNSQQLPPTPGTHIVNDRVYGRNYGHVFVALPLLWVLNASAKLADPSIALSLLWFIFLIALVAVVAPSLDRRQSWTTIGFSVATLLLLANIALAEPIEPKWNAWVALQLSTMIAAALVVAFVYRLLEAMYDQRTGVMAGLIATFATPLGFWATIPKRHSFSALFPLIALYCLYRSRKATTLQKATRYRALAYVPVGLATWIHSPEGFILFLALGIVDTSTARSNAPKQLAIVAGVFGLALLPFLLTNTLIASNPIEPPRVLPTYTGTAADTSTGGSVSGTSSNKPLGTAVGLLGVFLTYMVDSAKDVFDAGRMFDVFVRSGNELGIGQAIIGGRSLNLSMMESMPLAAALLATPVVLYQRVRDRGVPDWPGLKTLSKADPKRATDLMVVLYAVLLVLLYLPRLPIKVSFTVRYLHPLYPIGVYLLVRQWKVRQVLGHEWRLLGVTYIGTLLLGGPVVVLILVAAAGELEVAVQYHARLALATAAVVFYWAVIASVFEGYERGGAVALAIAGAVSTLYTLLSAWVYFSYTDQYALPIVRLIAESIVLW